MPGRLLVPAKIVATMAPQCRRRQGLHLLFMSWCPSRRLSCVSLRACVVDIRRRGRGGCGAFLIAESAGEAGLRRSRTTHLYVSARHVANTFSICSLSWHAFQDTLLWLSFLAAPLLTDTRRSAVGSGTREDFVTLAAFSGLDMSVAIQNQVGGRHGSTCSDGSTRSRLWRPWCWLRQLSCVLSCASAGL